MGNIYLDMEKEFSVMYAGWEGSAQFEGTGARLDRYFGEMCWDNYKIEEEVKKHFKSTFKDGYDEMLIVKDIEVWTLCPHHILPCEFSVNIGYIPNGYVLGLSKFARVAVTLGKRPVMQEMYTREVALAVDSNLHPEGVGVYVVGKHGCMGCRGIRQSQSSVSTTVLLGSFKEDSVVRQEFYSNLK